MFQALAVLALAAWCSGLRLGEMNEKYLFSCTVGTDKNKALQ